MRKFYPKSKRRKGMVSFTPKVHLSGHALAFSSSLVHTRLISSNTLSFLKPMQFIKRKRKAHTLHKQPINKDDTKKLYVTLLNQYILPFFGFQVTEDCKFSLKILHEFK